MILTASGTFESAVRFISSLLIFLFVLVITYFTSKFIANYQKQTMLSGNMEVVEVTRIAPNKYLQIVRAGKEYFLIAVCKDTITMLSKLDSEQLDFSRESGSGGQTPDFKAILEKAKNSRKKQADKNE